MYFTDYHMHTNFSSDSNVPMEEMIQQAIRIGLKEIAITDHIDYNYPDPNFPFLFSYEDYSQKIKEYKEKYRNQIIIRKGMELGLQPHVFEKSKELCTQYQYDFIIGSTHCVDKLELYGNSFFQGKSQKQAYRRYFEEVLENVQTCDFFNVYGHLDYINRYGDYTDRILEPMDYMDLIDEILKELIKKEMGLELNTSGFKYGLGYAHPQLSILKQYRKLGGEIITIGSDAHSPDYIAFHFKDAYEILQAAGFSAITVFENKMPRFLDIK